MSPVPVSTTPVILPGYFQNALLLNTQRQVVTTGNSTGVSSLSMTYTVSSDEISTTDLSKEYKYGSTPTQSLSQQGSAILCAEPGKRYPASLCCSASLSLFVDPARITFACHTACLVRA